VVQSGGRCGFFPERRKIMDLQTVSLSELESDCGAAALAKVAMHYRRPLGLEQMRDVAATDRRER
jgi:hypothetical protein